MPFNPLAFQKSQQNCSPIATIGERLLNDSANLLHRPVEFAANCGLSSILSIAATRSVLSLHMQTGNLKATDKVFFIKAYFDDLQKRIEFLVELHAMGRAKHQCIAKY